MPETNPEKHPGKTAAAAEVGRKQACRFFPRTFISLQGAGEGRFRLHGPVLGQPAEDVGGPARTRAWLHSMTLPGTAAMPPSPCWMAALFATFFNCRTKFEKVVSQFCLLSDHCMPASSRVRISLGRTTLDAAMRSRKTKARNRVMPLPDFACVLSAWCVCRNCAGTQAMFVSTAAASPGKMPAYNA